MSLRTISYGGGVQSTALLVLAANGLIDYKTFLFANTGDDSEHPATLAYIRDYAIPYAESYGITIYMLDRIKRDGTVETVRSRIMRQDRKSQVIPVRSSAGGPPMSRACTVDFKIEVLGRWLKKNGASADNPATVGIGISLDEIHRASRTPRPYEVIEYPLLEMGIRRTDCERYIRENGLPVPPKSSCYFCPFHTLGTWTAMRRDEPDLFAKAVEVEDEISRKTGEPRYLTRFGAPLIDVVPVGVDELPFDQGDGDCMSGVCAT